MAALLVQEGEQESPLLRWPLPSCPGRVDVGMPPAVLPHGTWREVVRGCLIIVPPSGMYMESVPFARTFRRRPALKMRPWHLVSANLRDLKIGYPCSLRFTCDESYTVHLLFSTKSRLGGLPGGGAPLQGAGPSSQLLSRLQLRDPSEEMLALGGPCCLRLSRDNSQLGVFAEAMLPTRGGQQPEPSPGTTHPSCAGPGLKPTPSRLHPFWRAPESSAERTPHLAPTVPDCCTAKIVKFLRAGDFFCHVPCWAPSPGIQARTRVEERRSGPDTQQVPAGEPDLTLEAFSESGLRHGPR
ncbi:hypothetical protein AB1E18_015858 [Capra hircus]